MYLKQDIITEEPETFSLSQSKLDEIEELRYQLFERKSSTLKKKKTLLGKLESLWNRLSIDTQHQDEIKEKSPGITPSDIQVLETVSLLLTLSSPGFIRREFSTAYAPAVLLGADSTHLAKTSIQQEAG